MRVVGLFYDYLGEQTVKDPYTGTLSYMAYRHS